MLRVAVKKKAHFSSSTCFLLCRDKHGFSLVGALTASVIGLMVTYGITHNLVQTKLHSLSMEKRERRKSLYSFVNNILQDSQACLNTLKGQDLSGSSSDPDRSFELAALKDASNGNLMDFSKDGNGNLTDSETKKQLKNLGIDKFESLKFRYKPARSSLGQVVLLSKTEVKGLHEKSNREIVWEISGLKVEAVSGHGDQVTLCPDSEPLKILCGSSVTGTSHGNGGGFVENTSQVDSGVYIAKTAVVCGNAKVKGSAKVLGNAQVTGNAEIKGNALVYDNAKISGNAVVQGNAKVYDSSKVSGSAVIKGKAEVYGSATIEGATIGDPNKVTRVYGTATVKNATVKGKAQIYGGAIVDGSGIEIYGNTRIYGNALVENNAKIYGNARVWDTAKVLNNAKVYGNAKIEGNARVAGQAQVYGNAKVNENGMVGGSVKVYGDARVTMSGRAAGDNVLIYGNANIYRFGPLGNVHINGNAGIADWVKGDSSTNPIRIGGDIIVPEGGGIGGTCQCIVNKRDSSCKNVILKPEVKCLTGSCNSTNYWHNC